MTLDDYEKANNVPSQKETVSTKFHSEWVKKKEIEFSASVEQFFGQMTLLSDHGTKLDSSQVADILSRVMLIIALRMLPLPQKGFWFLTKLKVHMKSYRAPIDEVNTHKETFSTILALCTQLAVLCMCTQETLTLTKLAQGTLNNYSDMF